MLFLKELHSTNFKNLDSLDLHFDSKYVCFAGNNGAGKTNLLDAIHYLAMGKSYFNSIDAQNIRYEESFFNLQCKLERKQEEFDLFCAFVQGMKKKLRNNGKEYEKLADHVGEFPVVIVTPYDNSLISGGSEERRRFLDMIISQMDKTYLDNLLKYNRLLLQRNAQLKKMSEQHLHDRKLLGVYDQMLHEKGQFIYERRLEFVSKFSVLTLDYYSKISDSKEQIYLSYQSQLSEKKLLELFEDNFQKDLHTQRTNVGIHKDDLELNIHGYAAKRFASQGQQKSYLLSMKLAQFKLMKDNKGLAPLFLLDDIFDRLDRHRITRLMDLITENGFGQIFITDTNAERVSEVFKKLGKEISIFRVEDGMVSHY